MKNFKKTIRLRITLTILIILNFPYFGAFAQNDIILNDIKPKSARNITADVELIEYVGNPNLNKSLIKNIVYKLNNKDKKLVMVIKPHLYLASGKKVGKELLPIDVQLVYVKQTGKELIVQVDVSKYQIAIPPEGVFVGLEFVGTIEETTKILQKIGVLAICNNRENLSSLSYSKYKNVFDKEVSLWGCALE